MKHADFSVGRRLGLGFALLLLTICGLIGAVLTWHADSAREQRAFIEEVAPVTARADALERSILYLAIRLRTYLLTPGPAQLQRYRDASEQVRTALSRLAPYAKDTDEEKLYRELERAVQHYLSQAGNAARSATVGRDARIAADEQAGAARETAIALVHDFVKVQDRKAAKALAAMAQSRDRVLDGLIAASVIALALGLIVAYFTAQSIRSPTRQLLELARALTRGELGPALRWAPPEGAADKPPRSEMLQLAHAFGTAAVALERRDRELRTLLAELQEKNERIELQNEELQAQHEEVQVQHEEIQAQHEEIQTQTDELQSQNEQLRQQAEELQARALMLAEADERKNEFLGFLAHELRNPTSAIANGLFVLERAPPDSDAARSAQAIMQRQTRQLARLIDDLLDTTRISRGKIELERQTVNFTEVVRDGLADYEGALGTRELSVKADLPHDDVWVDGDRARLSQVVGNLLSNAIKFSEDGGNIAVTLAAREEEGVANLRVSDEGCGIDPALLPQLFTPFTQGATSLARTKGGLGLGLALVRSLVELHGGTVTAHSAGPGCGAEFVVSLPLGRPPTGMPARPKLLPRRWRVLIVEDNGDAAESLRAGAALQGYEVRVAHDGYACLDMIHDFRPQVVLCDIGLPGMDGYELAGRLRADASLADIHLIAVSGYASPQDKARALAAGFDCHVAKPLKMDELESMLAVLERNAKARA